MLLEHLKRSENAKIYPVRRFLMDNETEDIHEQPTFPLSVGDHLSGPQTKSASPVQLAEPVSTGSPHFSRRTILGVAAVGVGATALGATAVGANVLGQWWQHAALNTPTHGSLANSMQIGHLLRRAGFGATSGELATYRSLGFNGAVDRLLNYQQVSDTAMESRLNALNLDFTKPVNQQRWWLLRMVWTQRPLLEKMTLFWHGVLTSSYRKVGGPKAYTRMMVQNQFLRQHAFDTFDNILLGITGDPAILFYLDLAKIKKLAPNENYARELMELFTLGPGNYTQQDVYQAAASLTGWHLGSGATSSYLPQTHNTLTKTFLGHTGNLDYKDIIRILTNHPAAPWFICTKLFTFFVHENPSKDDLTPLVNAYEKSGHNMGEVMRALLLSPQFSSIQAYRSRVKSPTEYVVGTYRALDLQGDGTGLPTLTAIIGQTLLDPPNVAGWPGDKVSSLWINSGTWMSRLNYIDLLLLGGRNAQRVAISSPLDLQSIVTKNNIDSPDHFVHYFATFLLHRVLDQNRRPQFISYMQTPHPKITQI